jgi:hypothetical protein
MNIKTIKLDECLSIFDNGQEYQHGGVELNARCDMRYAHNIQSFSKVIHVFSMEWKGIRSAVGAMGGAKLAMTADRPMRCDEILFALHNIRKFEKVIFHGVSANGRILIEHLYRQSGPDCYVVWHGSHAQLSLDHERELFLATKRLYEKGFVKKLHIMRGGCHLLLNCWPEILFNAPLNIVGEKFCQKISENGIALVPMTASMGKNLYTNIIAAAVSSKIKTINTYNGNNLMDICNGKTIKFLRHNGVAGHLKVLENCAVSLNVTCIDCQPMIDIEAVSAGTPAITGPLFLENYFKSTYPKLTTVQNPLSPEEIIKKIDKLDAIPGGELAAMMTEYKAELLQKHIESYNSFFA